MNVFPVSGPQNPIQTQQTVAGLNDASSPGTFSAIISEVLQSANSQQVEADQQAGKLFTGDVSNFHEVSLAVAQADLSFQFLMAMRDQLVTAYRDVMKMQI